MTTIESILTKLENFGIDTFYSLVSTYNVESVANVSGDTWELTTTVELSGIVEGHYVNITAGVNSGFHLITSVGTDTVQFVSATGDVQGQLGQAKFYTVKEGSLNQIIDVQKSYIENIIGYNPFDGEQQIIELYNGTGSGELMLNRRPVISIQEIKVLDRYYTELLVSLSNITIENNTGILKTVNIFSNSGNRLSLFPRGIKNIKITYTVGEATTPNDINNALSLLSCADILGNQAGFDGGGNSLSVVSYSKSYGANGKYSEIRNQYINTALSLLSKYKTGIVS